MVQQHKALKTTLWVAACGTSDPEDESSRDGAHWQTKGISIEKRGRKSISAEAGGGCGWVFFIYYGVFQRQRAVTYRTGEGRGFVEQSVQRPRPHDM